MQSICVISCADLFPLIRDHDGQVIVWDWMESSKPCPYALNNVSTLALITDNFGRY